jgi:hypothetical protein
MPATIHDFHRAYLEELPSSLNEFLPDPTVREKWLQKFLASIDRKTLIENLLERVRSKAVSVDDILGIFTPEQREDIRQILGRKPESE